jgi:hypothetical protein
VTYASQTTVSIEKSKHEIEHTLQRYGASKFIYGWDQEEAVIGFVVAQDDQHRQVRFKVRVPELKDFFVTSNYRQRSRAAAEKAWEQAQRQRWRALLLVIKAKLEAIEAGIATFEDEFLAYTMLPSGQTVGEWMQPQLYKAYDKGEMPSSLRLALPAGDS